MKISGIANLVRYAANPPQAIDRYIFEDLWLDKLILQS